MSKKNSRNGIRAVLPICFDDVDQSDPFCMTQEHAKMIAKFLRLHLKYSQRLVVHCDAGISRSAAICAAIMYRETGSDMAIFDSAQYRPNMHCYRLMLNELI